jgi:hypothetical protein
MRWDVLWGALAGVALLVAAWFGLSFVLSNDDGTDPTRVNLVGDTGAPGAAASTGPTTLAEVTIPPTSATTTTLAPTTTLFPTDPPTLPPPTTPAPPPARLEVAATQLDLGTEDEQVAVAIGNSGGQGMGWTTSSDNALVSATPSGLLAPGTQAAVDITITRTGLIEGDYVGTVSVLGAGRAVPITVRWRVERAPVVHVALDPPGLDDAKTCPADSPTLNGLVTVEVIDESAISGVTMTVAGTEPGQGGTTMMPATGPGVWSAPLGPLSGAGEWSVTVTATDARGNPGSGGTTFVVTACHPGKATTTTTLP